MNLGDENRIFMLEKEVRKLQGRVSELENKTKKQQEEISSLEERLNRTRRKRASERQRAGEVLEIARREGRRKAEKVLPEFYLPQDLEIWTMRQIRKEFPIPEEDEGINGIEDDDFYGEWDS